jgi:hypothetical protein
VGFDIPNEGAGVDGNQSELDAADFEILVAGHERTGVRAGCGVTPHANPLTVVVAVGTVELRATEVAVAGGNVVLDAADPVNPRFDLIVVNGAGALGKITGTPAPIDGVPGPVFPAIPKDGSGSLDRVVLAAVWVPAGDSIIQVGQIRDRRVPLAAPSAGGGGGGSSRIGYLELATSSGGATGTSSNAQVAGASGQLAVNAPDSGEVDVVLSAWMEINNAAAVPVWFLKDAANAEIAGSRRSLLGGATSTKGRVTTRTRVSGLVPGNSYTFKWWSETDFGTLSTYHSTDGNRRGRATMEIWAI